MEIKEGMYVRTEYGIFKIIRIIKDLGYNEREKRVLELDRNIPELNYNYEFYKDESIFKNAKFSSNLIDLIEARDYVNGCVVTRICIDKETGKKYLNMYGSISEWENEDIKSVVTKEQFESIKYEVK